MDHLSLAERLPADDGVVGLDIALGEKDVKHRGREDLVERLGKDVGTDFLEDRSEVLADDRSDLAEHLAVTEVNRQVVVDAPGHDAVSRELRIEERQASLLIVRHVGRVLLDCLKGLCFLLIEVGTGEDLLEEGFRTEFLEERRILERSGELILQLGRDRLDLLLLRAALVIVSLLGGFLLEQGVELLDGVLRPVGVDFERSVHQGHIDKILDVTVAGLFDEFPVFRKGVPFLHDFALRHVFERLGNRDASESDSLADGIEVPHGAEGVSSVLGHFVMSKFVSVLIFILSA